MCFSQEMSGGFSLMGLVFTLYAWRGLNNPALAKGVFYFVLMETLQFVQYSFIADDVDPAAPTLEALQASPKCQASINQFLTFLGFLHICFQPVASMLMISGNSCMVQDAASLAQNKLVFRMQVVGGFWMLYRGVLALYPDVFESLSLGDLLGTAAHYHAGGVQGHLPREWISGGTLCTYLGETHLAWSIPLISPSYYVPSMALHFFLMFVPYFLVDYGNTYANLFNYVCGVGLFFTGPALGDLITPNKHEAASIWCFFSMIQCCTAVILNAVIMAKGKEWMLPGQWKELKATKAKAS